MAKNVREKNSKDDIAGLVFVGCLFVGMAAGFVFWNIPAGVLGGLGTGFIGMAAVRLRLKK